MRHMAVRKLLIILTICGNTIGKGSAKPGTPLKLLQYQTDDDSQNKTDQSERGKFNRISLIFDAKNLLNYRFFNDPVNNFINFFNDIYNDSLRSSVILSPIDINTSQTR